MVHVTELSRNPKSRFKTESFQETTTITRKDIYGHVGTIFQLSADPNYMGMKVEATIDANARAELRKSKENIKKIRQTGELGDKPVSEVVLGMLIRVEEVYSHSIRLEMDNRGTSKSLHWTAEQDWSQVEVPHQHLSEVKGLQFPPVVPMSGDSQVTKLWIQTLPVLDKHHEICDLHIAVSSTGWSNWYAYTEAHRGTSKGREIVAWPAHQPAMAFIEVGQKPQF